MNDLSVTFDEEKNRVTEQLSDQYSKNIINMEEYERLIEYLNKIETVKELNIVKEIIRSNEKDDEEIIPQEKNTGNHVTIFSWRTTNVKPYNGFGGKFSSIFGTNRVIFDNLPPGKTVVEVESIFGLTEIIVPYDVKIVNQVEPVFSGVFAPDEIDDGDAEMPELYVRGRAIFGNITIIRKKKKFKINIDKLFSRSILCL